MERNVYEIIHHDRNQIQLGRRENVCVDILFVKGSRIYARTS